MKSLIKRILYTNPSQWFAKSYAQFKPGTCKIDGDVCSNLVPVFKINDDF